MLCVVINFWPLSPEGIAPRGSGKKPTTASILEGDTGRLEQAVEKEGGRATLRLKKDGEATVEEVVSIVYLTSPRPLKNCRIFFILHPIVKTLTPLESS